MLQDPGRSQVIVCHSREIGNILLGYYHLEKYENGGKENGDRAGIWFGYWSIRSCVAMDTGHSLVTLFSLSVLVKDRSLHKPSRQVTDLLSRAHTWAWALGRLIAILSWVPALFGSIVRVLF